MLEFATAFLLLGWVGQTPRADATPARRPNVVVIYADDLARWAVGAYGNPDVKTPHLDRLAREGALFRNAFTVTPVCSPSRATMMTSRYPTELGIDDWINPSTEPNLGLAPSAILWPELLRGAGYSTMLAGKWHLGTRDEFHPTRQGYDRFFGFRAGGNQPMNPTLEVDGRETKLEGSLPDLLVDRCLEFLESSRSRPFLLSLHFREPHAPYAPTPEVDARPFRDSDPAVADVPGLPTARVKRLLREYHASVHALDRNVGRLLDALDRLDLARDTIVMFTSDHGYMIGQHGLWHKGNGVWLVEGKKGPRPNMFDDSIRVPLLVRWPARVKPGTSVESLVSNLDVFPTILDMTGIGTPANLSIRGRSMLPALEDPARDREGDQATFFGQYDMHHTKVAHMRMVRTGGWKFVRHFEDRALDELYDLRSDPGETRNLIEAPEARERLDGLATMLASFMTSIHDPLAGESRHAPEAGRSGTRSQAP